jgi:hypothetical protein
MVSRLILGLLGLLVIGALGCGNGNEDSELPPPGNLEATSLGERTAIQLSWNAAGNPDSIAIERASTDLGEGWVPLEVINADTSEYIDEQGLRDGVEYEYRIRSIRGGEESDYSNVASAQISAMATPIP